jgi:hypothetical protein
VIEIVTFIAFGTLALGFDRPIAAAMSKLSIELGELCRRHGVWGTLSPPSDLQASYRNFLFFVRFWGSVMALQGMCLVLLTS